MKYIGYIISISKLYARVIVTYINIRLIVSNSLSVKNTKNLNSLVLIEFEITYSG